MEKRILILMAILMISSAALLAASQDLTAEGKKNLTSANLHLTGNRYEKALPFYELVLEDNPHHIEAINNMAAIYFDMINDYKQANELYSLLLIEIDDIFAEYNALLETDEKAAKKFHKKYIKKADIEDIKATAQNLIQGCWYKLFIGAQTDFDEENLQSSLDKFIYVLEIAPDSVKTLKMISYVYAQLGDADQSLNYMIKVAETDPADDMVRTQIGNTNFENGNYEDAVNWYKAAAEINMANIDNYFNMALAYSNLKDQENSLVAYEKVLEYEPDNLDALIYASNIYAQSGKLEQSIIYLKKAIELDPANIDWISFLSFKLAQEKRYEEVLEYATKWKNIDPESTDAQQLINLAKQNLK